MVLEHFTVCYKQSITLQNFVFIKFQFIEQYYTTKLKRIKGYMIRDDSFPIPPTKTAGGEPHLLIL